MKTKIAFWFAAAIIISILSVLLSGIIQNLVILPFLKLFWLLKGYFGSIHQVIIWGVVVTGAVIIAAVSLKGGNITFLRHKERHESLPGEVNQLAFWIRSSKRGPYPRWYLARTFADLAIELLRNRGENVERGGLIKGPDWNPPGTTREYLDTAMHSTPATFARLIESNHVGEDPNPDEIIKYFESYMEEING